LIRSFFPKLKVLSDIAQIVVKKGTYTERTWKGGETGARVFFLLPTLAFPCTPFVNHPSALVAVEVCHDRNLCEQIGCMTGKEYGEVRCSGKGDSSKKR
jgi:hypothetical protein